MKIAIASGKGGTGKTTLATNLSYLLSKDRPVVLADLDVEEPNSRFFVKGKVIENFKTYKMIPEWNKGSCILCGHCQKVCRYNAVIKLWEEILIVDQLCHGCYACSELCPEDALPMKAHEMGQISVYSHDELHFVEGRLNIGEEQAVPLIAQTKEYVRKQYPEDFIRIFDSPPGTSCPVIEAVKDADFVILVTEPTPFGLHDLKLAVDVVKELNKKFGVVINRHGIGNNATLEYCQKENIPVLGMIPNMKKAAETYAKGELLSDKLPEIRTSIENIINELASRGVIT